MINKSSSSHLVSIAGRLETSGTERSIVLELTDQTASAIGSKLAVAVEETNAKRLEDIAGVVIDLSFIHSDPDGSLGRLSAAIKKVSGRAHTPIFLIAKEAAVEELVQKSKLAVHDLFFKPLDRGYFVRKVRQAILHSQGSAEAARIEPYVQFEGWIDIAKPITANGIGEYGLEFTYTSRVPEGAWGYFYHPELLDEQGRGLMGRCIRTEVAGEGKFKMQFLFLGIREDMLRQIRLFIKKFSIMEAKQRSSGT